MPADRRFKDPTRAKKRFGQNFLVDANVIEKIVECGGVAENGRVVEIGPGRGALTAKLLARGAEVFAIEIDRDLQDHLSSEFRDDARFHLIEDDILQTRLSDHAASPFSVFGNLPYNISTAILERLIDEREAFTDATLMFQREVADRILARVSTPDRGYLSVISQAAFRIEKCFDIAPSAFRPAPKVWSTVLRFFPNEKNVFDTKSVRKLVSLGFSERRKMLRNTLKPLLGASRVEFDLTRRAESLTLEDWTFLAAELERQASNHS